MVGLTHTNSIIKIYKIYFIYMSLTETNDLYNKVDLYISTINGRTNVYTLDKKGENIKLRIYNREASNQTYTGFTESTIIGVVKDMVKKHFNLTNPSLHTRKGFITQYSDLQIDGLLISGRLNQNPYINVRAFDLEDKL